MAGCTKIPLVLTDGEIEQLQAGDLVTVVLGDLNGDLAGVSVRGNLKSLQVADLRLIDIAREMLSEMKKIRKHISSITEERWDDDDHDED